MDKKFTIFPNRLFYTNDDEVSLYKQCKNYKILLVLDYLYNAIDKKGFSKFTIEDIITTYGYKLNRRKAKLGLIDNNIKNSVAKIIDEIKEKILVNYIKEDKNIVKK